MITACLLVMLGFTLLARASRCVMYLTGQHVVIPEAYMVQDITHVTLAFMPSSRFNVVNNTDWSFFATVEEVRTKFADGTAIMIAIGGWGDTDAFSYAAVNQDRREVFARNIKNMLDHTGADGVDVDWEYPGGNSEDYKRVPNEAKSWEIEEYPKLLQEIRSTIGPHKIMSAAVPGLPRDLLAFTTVNMPVITATLDFINVMTYDLKNRRDHETGHHAGISASLTAIDAYLERGLSPEKINLGFAFYIKWFNTAEDACQRPVGCPTKLLEDPETGSDLGNAGAFSWHDRVPEELLSSYNKAMSLGEYDEIDGGHYFHDTEHHIYWTWETPYSIKQKVGLVSKRKLGGVFAWGLGEDAPGWTHLQALMTAIGDQRQTPAMLPTTTKDEL